MKRFKGSIPLGRLFGIPIGVDYSWFLIFALMSWSLATSYYPSRFGEWGLPVYWAAAASTTVLLFVGVLLHELGHALVARLFHVPVRRIRLLLFGGVAELGEESPSAGSEFAIAVAGPIVSAITAAGWAAIWITLRFTGQLEPIMAVSGYLALLNVMLALFNLIPGFPLDGGRVLRAVLWGATGSLRQATNIAGMIGRVIGFGFLGVGVFQALTGNVSNGLWTAFIGMFLQRAAAAELQSQKLRDLLSGRTVAQVMSDSFITLPSMITIQQIVNSLVLQRGIRTFAVTDDDKVRGLLTVSDIEKVPGPQRMQVTAGQAMQPLDGIRHVSPDTELWTALQRMEIDGLPQLPVMQDGRLLGLLRREDVFGFLYSLRRLGPQAI